MRDSVCSVVSDSEVRRWDDASMMEASGNGRPLISKDANWILSSHQQPPHVNLPHPHIVPYFH